jgi:hypothetical protein
MFSKSGKYNQWGNGKNGHFRDFGPGNENFLTQDSITFEALFIVGNYLLKV